MNMSRFKFRAWDKRRKRMVRADDLVDPFHIPVIPAVEAADIALREFDKRFLGVTD